jgi:hypothetical protein
MTIDDEGWRRLCRLVADEPDPERMSELIDELFKALDEKKQRGAGDVPNPPSTTNSSSSRARIN